MTYISAYNLCNQGIIKVIDLLSVPTL